MSAVNGADEAPAKAAPKKRKMSGAGRKRTAEATKKRWAEFQAKKAAAAKTVPKNRYEAVRQESSHDKKGSRGEAGKKERHPKKLPSRSLCVKKTATTLQPEQAVAS